jgi:hypothetical protein
MAQILTLAMPEPLAAFVVAQLGPHRRVADTGVGLLGAVGLGRQALQFCKYGAQRGQLDVIVI